MTTYYVRKDRAFDGSEGPPDASGVAFYFFDGSDAAASDPDTAWTDETNADDADVATIAFTTTAGTASTNELKLEGTNAPASGPTINSVDLWVYHGPGSTSTSSAVQVHTDGEGELLLNSGSWTEAPGSWVGPSVTPITAPAGGWTYAKLQALEVLIYQSGASRLEVAAIGVMVHTTTEGESTTDPFRTIDDAANAVAAADDVWVGAGVYREQVTMDTSGTSGNQIRFMADVDGSQTGDAGLVVISAYANETSAATRSYCVNLNAQTYVTWDGFVMTGGTVATFYSGAANNGEEVVINECVIVGGHDDADEGLSWAFADSTAPTIGPRITRTTITNSTRIFWDLNAVADKDRDMVFENCILWGNGAAGIYTLWWDQAAGSGSFGATGLSVTNCTIIGGNRGIVADSTSVTGAITVKNCYLVGQAQSIRDDDAAADAITSDYNTFAAVNSPFVNVTSGANDNLNTNDPGLWGGIADAVLYQKLGWSPFKPWEPIRLQDDSYVHAVIGDADSTTAPATDFYGNPRPMSQAGTTQSIYYFDASDAGPTDDEAVWTNDSNAFDGSVATKATTTASGNSTLNELRASGTTAPTTGLEIVTVETRFFASSTDATGDANFVVMESDGTTSLWGSAIINAVSAGEWTSWYTLTTHSGGWTWQKINDLVGLYYSTGGTDTSVHVIQIRVTHAAGNNDDRGAVEGRARPEQDTGSVMTGVNSMVFSGAGIHDFLIPVAAQSTTITIDGRYDSNYTGSLPKMEVFNIPGVADKTDTMVAAANTDETLTSGAFTPTSAGVCRVRITSQDTSYTGKAYFDALTVT